MRVIDFKTVQPFFDQERDGRKPFTTRLVDWKDPRYIYLLNLLQGQVQEKETSIRITNPKTHERFQRRLVGMQWQPGTETWLNLQLGEVVK